MRIVELLPPLFAILIGCAAAWVMRPAPPPPNDDDDHTSNYQ